jgi:hypothetical protein
VAKRITHTLLYDAIASSLAVEVICQDVYGDFRGIELNLFCATAPAASAQSPLENKSRISILARTHERRRGIQLTDAAGR